VALVSSDITINIGDVIIDIHGNRGVVDKICDCDKCKERGFYEPVWIDAYANQEYITESDRSSGFSSYFQIGSHRFPEHVDRGNTLSQINKLEREAAQAARRIENLRMMLEVTDDE